MSATPFKVYTKIHFFPLSKHLHLPVSHVPWYYCYRNPSCHKSLHRISILVGCMDALGEIQDNIMDISVLANDSTVCLSGLTTPALSRPVSNYSAICLYPVLTTYKMYRFCFPYTFGHSDLFPTEIEKCISV